MNIDYNFTYRQKDKGWQVILSYKDGSKWRQKSKQGLKTKQQAKAVGEQLLSDLKRTFVPSSHDLKGTTLREFMPIFLKVKMKDISQATFRAYRNLVLFFPEIYDTPMDEITTVMISRILIRRKAFGYSVATQRLNLTLLKAVFSSAANNYGIIRENPVKGIKLDRRPPKKIQTISSDEFEKLLDSPLQIKNESYKIICITAYYTGMRFGEILGLSWNNIDFEKKEITIEKQFKKHYENNKLSYRFGALKTPGSYRTIPIPDTLVTYLQYWKAKSKHNLVFPSPTSNSEKVNRWIRKSIPGRTIHSFRHTYATNLLAHGVNIQTVAALCGDTVETILKTYIDYTNEMRMQAAKDVNRIF
ncbi:site-specific integrase [uncultured Megasphaera sp.]|uniref:tyrosine-type recombinase/integrase n=1 Tax=uncultured Megasphaera sp. TaxID=165188 RepID=UPI00266CD770|nr:site-specific integrase [uncultured Megasphaera sp.]